MKALVATVCLCIPAFVPAAAAASTVTVGLDAKYGGYQEVHYLAAPGERNDLVVAYAADSYSATVTDPGAVVRATGTCSSVSAHVAVCRGLATADFLYGAAVDLGDLDDRARITEPEPGIPHALTASGGSGDDTLIGSPAFDVLDGGAGRDVLDGGDGVDEVSYATRTGPVAVDLSDAEPDGEAGEDDVLHGIESVTGGAGDDRLVGDDRDNTLDGGPGRNRLSGRGGDDDLANASGTAVGCGPGDDVVFGQSADTLVPKTCERLNIPIRYAQTNDGAVTPTPRRRAGSLGLTVTCPTNIDDEPERCAGTVRIRIAASRRLLARGTLRDRGFASERFLRLTLTPLARRLRANGRRELATVVIRGRIGPTTRWSIGF